MDVNYIREINAFYNELEIRPLSSSAISLWYALLHLNNRCGWKDSFSVPVGTLSLKSGVSDRSISNARNELKTKEYLTFQSRDGNKSAVYQLKRLSAKFADNSSGNPSDKCSDSSSDNVSGNASALNIKHKQNKTKKEINNSPLDPPKGDSTKVQYADYVFLTVEEHTKLTELLGESERDRLFLEYAAWISGQPPRVKKERSAYLTILNWHRRGKDKPAKQQGKSRYQRTVDVLEKMYVEASAGEQNRNH